MFVESAIILNLMVNLIRLGFASVKWAMSLMHLKQFTGLADKHEYLVRDYDEEIRGCGPDFAMYFQIR